MLEKAVVELNNELMHSTIVHSSHWIRIWSLKLPNKNVSFSAIHISHAWRHNPTCCQDVATTLGTQMAVDKVGERQPAEPKWKQTQWDSVLGRMLALLYSLPCSPMPSSATTAVRRERERGREGKRKFLHCRGSQAEDSREGRINQPQSGLWWPPVARE